MQLKWGHQWEVVRGPYLSFTPQTFDNRGQKWSCVTVKLDKGRKANSVILREHLQCCAGAVSVFASEENSFISMHVFIFSLSLLGCTRFWKLQIWNRMSFSIRRGKNGLDTIRSLRAHILLCRGQKWTSDLHHLCWQEPKSKRTLAFCKIPAIQFNSFVPWKTHYHLSGIELRISLADLVLFKTLITQKHCIYYWIPLRNIERGVYAHPIITKL